MYSDNNISQEVDLLEKGELVNTQIPLQKKQNWLRGVAKTVLGFFLTVTILVFWTVAWQNTFTPPKGNQSGSSRQRCESPARRTEWRQLSKSQQRDFIDAVHCLAERPSILNSNLEGTTMSSKNSSSRYDDFVWVHIQLYEKTHNVAPSLPWHRYFIRVFEKTLQEECGYSSSLPYWDWTLDAENPRRSPIWDEEFGVGGNGTGTSHCVSDGPFKDWTLQWPEKHCLRRRFDPVMSGSNFTDEIIRNIRRRSGTYQGFRESLESGPHKAIHNSIGGEMPTHDSPNDPIFWLHHGQIDRLWWEWQIDDLPDRLQNYGGPTTIGSEVFDADLEDDLLMLGLAKDVAIKQVMDIKQSDFCYGYNEL